MDADAAPPGPAFLSGGGVLGTMMRAHNWAATPLGPPGTWPQPLKTLVEVMLCSSQPMFIAWGPERTLLYNDPYAEILAGKHPAALGRPFLQVWSEIRADLLPIVEQAYAGVPVHMDRITLSMHRHGHAETAHFSFSYTPVRDEAGAVAGFFCPCNEITAQVVAERRQAHLLALEGRLREAATARQALDATCETLGRALDGVLCTFNEFGEDAEHVEVTGEWRTAGTPSALGRHRMADWGAGRVADLLSGAPEVVEDVRTDPRAAGSGAEAYAAIGCLASLSVPLVRDGRVRAMLAVGSARPRHWLPDEVALAAAVVERAWHAVERARAEDRLREANEALDRRAAERQDVLDSLRAERDRSRSILQSMGDGFVLLDRGFHVRDINAEGLRIDGRPREQIVDRHLLDAWPEAEHFPVWPAYQRAMAGRVPVALEYNYVSDRRNVWLDVRAYPVAEGGEGLAVFYRDITGRKRAEERLRESEARHRRTLDIETVAVVYFDMVGGITGANDTFLRLVGYTRAELEAGEVRYESLTPPEWAWRDGQTIRELLTTGHGGPSEKEYFRRDGSRMWILCASRMLDERTAVEFVIDITEQKAGEAALRGSEARLRELNETLEARVAERTAELMAAEASLRQVQKMEAVGQLTGGIAHDFNNMLQAIGGSLELLQRRVAQGRADEAARLAKGIGATVERAAALTHRLLAFARRQQLQPRPVDPDELVEGLAELIRRTVGPAVTVELRKNDGLWAVLCDPGQLENALLNLAINARDAMPDGGRLTVSTRHVRLEPADVADQDGAAPGDYVEIAVSDTGTGMDEATQARVFEPFFTTKPIGQGTGLGLSQVYGFVRQSNGAVRLDSAPHQGTTVRLYLPRHEPEPAQPAHPPAAEPDRGAGNGTVLLVEDEAGVRAVVAEHLRELGYAVLEAADGSEALRVLDGSRGAEPGLLMTDVGLPHGLNGRQVADKARERRPMLPVLFMTGYAGTALDEHLAPGMAVIAKPFTLDALAGRIRAMLDGTPAQ